MKGRRIDCRNVRTTSCAADGQRRVPVDVDCVKPEASEDFVCSPIVEDITNRALAYLEAGYPVHFAGPAGTGKTTLAYHVAARIGRPVTLVHGDDEFGSSDLVGNESGVRKRRLVDNFIHSVLKTEEETKTLWVDNRLTSACKSGHTLIYDEFTRSRPEANNVLLSVLAEGILDIPKLRQDGLGYVNVHPEFRAIFTSNPEEYAGTHKTQDALMDRMITIHVGHHDRESEVLITMAKSGCSRGDAEVIVDIVRELRDVGVTNNRPTIRACIAIARVLVIRGGRAHPDDPVFQWVTQDVLTGETVKITRSGESLMREKVYEVIQAVCKNIASVRDLEEELVVEVEKAEQGREEENRASKEKDHASQGLERHPDEVEPVSSH